MKRALIAAVLSSLIGLLGACTTGDNGDTTGGFDGGPIVIQLFAASPSQGPTPLRSTLTASITGGTAPYFYAWDFENDELFDDFLNSSFNRNVSREHTFLLRAEDAAAGQSTYDVVLRVRDSNNREVLSDPITVTVAGSQTLVIDPDPQATFAFSDEQAIDGTYIFRNGEPVFFRVGVSGGAEPLSYQWDFNNDGATDSTVPNPQYIYNNNESGVKTFLAQVRVVDANGEEDFFSFTIPVEGLPLPPGSVQEFEVVLISSPPASNGVIPLRFDPTAGAGDSTDSEPRLELNAGVSADPAKRGVPPYEFYWDFENDGKIDSQAQSPTIPYYDERQRVTVNPYMHSDDERSFTLRLLVIDSAGQQRTVLATVKAINVEDRPADTINVNVSYDADGAGQPYAEVLGSSDSAVFSFNVTASGSTGSFEYQVDVDGDGAGDVPPANAFTAMSGGSANFSITFGAYDNDGNPNTPNAADWPVPQYYPAALVVRSVSSGNEVDRVVIQTPVSLVQLGLDEAIVDADPSTANVVDGTLDTRSDHAMGGFASVQVGGPNGETLGQRGVIIAGGTRGTTALREVVRIVENFNPPAMAGERETRAGFVTAFDGLPLTVARRGSEGIVTAVDPEDPNTPADAQFYVLFGRNQVQGAMADAEFQALSNLNAPWVVSSAELNLGGLYPVYDFGSTRILDANNNFIGTFAGGLNQPTPNSNANASAETYGLVPGVPTDPADDGMGSFGVNLRAPRYELTLHLIDGALFAVGGRVAGGQSISTVERLGAGSWQEVSSMRDHRAGHSSVAIDGKIYVYGGGQFASSGSSFNLLGTAEVYNPETDTWSYTVPQRAGRATYDGKAARLPGLGGQMTGNKNFNTAWLFGGQADFSGSIRETAFLQEFIYFYVIAP